MSAPSRRLLLQLVDGATPPAELPRSGVLTIGSSSDRAGFVVEGEGVADVHCAIGKTKGGGWALKDLGSDRGTLVNGKTIQAVRLKPGDEIRIGSRRLNIVDADATPKASSPKDARPDPAAQAGNKPRQAPSGNGVSIPIPRIDGYRIVSPLGRGGMGEVYLAVQVSLDREVALKVLSRKVEADSEFVRRFQAEARAAAALNHPNVVTVHDVGESNGVHYLSMEYMDAGNLEARVARTGALESADALRVLRDAASGLVFAEAKGIVHRDIKPANLMQNHSGTTKIADLGLATHVDAEEAPEGKKVFGTPHFMSPEQARGERLDGRSDLYSLGATAYRLLSGRTPFEGDSSRDILRAHLRDEPTPLRDIAPGVEAGLAALVERLMQKDPADRFSSASEVVRELDRLAGPGGEATASASARRPRTALAVLALALLAAAVVGWRFLPKDNGTTQAGGHDNTPKTSTDTPGGTPLDTELPADVADLPPLPPLGHEGTSADQPPTGTDTELKLREAEARVAFLELDSRALTPTERRDELRSLAARFRGTTAANDALEQAELLSEGVRTADEQERLDRERVTVVLAGLQRAATLDGTTPVPPLNTFAAMAAVEGQADFEDTPSFVAARRELEQGIVDAAVGHARTTLADIEEACDKGSFDDIPAALDELLPLLELPPDVDTHELSGLEQLRELELRVEELRSSLGERATRFADQTALADARAIADVMRGANGSGVEHQLESLDLVSASEALRSVAGTLHGEAARGFATTLAQDLSRAHDVFRTLAAAFEGVGWRRTKITDPRGRGRSAHDAVGADDDGLLLRTSSGVEKLPWAAFAGNTKELHRLFNDRLERSWTRSERDAIAALMRISAVTETLAVVTPLLVPDGRRSLLQRESERVREAFENARLWSQGEEARRLERERSAALRLLEVIEHSFAERWSEAASGTKHVLAAYADTLLVRTLADGTTYGSPRATPFVDLPAPEAEEEEEPDSDDPESGTGDEDETRQGSALR